MMLTSDLRQALKDQMEAMEKQNELVHRGGYISEDFVQRLFTPENLMDQLQLDRTTEGVQDVQGLVNFIRIRARKTFAILVRIGEGKRIATLQNSQPMVDDHLLFDNHDGDASKPYCILKKLQGIPALHDLASEVYKIQWDFPTAFSPDHHLEFDPRFFKFPFQTKSKCIANGGNGHVYRVKFEEGCVKDLSGGDIVSFAV